MKKIIVCLFVFGILLPLVSRITYGSQIFQPVEVKIQSYSLPINGVTIHTLAGGWDIPRTPESPSCLLGGFSLENTTQNEIKMKVREETLVFLPGNEIKFVLCNVPYLQIESGKLSLEYAAGIEKRIFRMTNWKVKGFLNDQPFFVEGVANDPQQPTVVSYYIENFLDKLMFVLLPLGIGMIGFSIVKKVIQKKQSKAWIWGMIFLCIVFIWKMMNSFI